MYIVMITPECAPVAKVGGLGDVAQGLSYELSIRGNDVELILPKYDCMRYDRIWGLAPSHQGLMVPFAGEIIACDVWFGFVDGLKCYFIDPHSRHLFSIVESSTGTAMMSTVSHSSAGPPWSSCKNPASTPT